MNQIAALLLAAVLTASHLTAYHMGRNAEDGAKLDQALAYAAEIVERQARSMRSPRTSKPSAQSASRRTASSRKRLSAMRNSLPIAAALSILLGACSTTLPPRASPPTPPAWLLVTPTPLRTLPPSKPSPATMSNAASTSTSSEAGSAGGVK